MCSFYSHLSFYRYLIPICIPQYHCIARHNAPFQPYLRIKHTSKSITPSKSKKINQTHKNEPMTKKMNINRKFLKTKGFDDSTLHAFEHVWKRIESQKRNDCKSNLLNGLDICIDANDVIFEVVKDDDGYRYVN